MPSKMESSGFLRTRLLATRWRHHAVLGVITAALICVILIIEEGDLLDGLSIASAYACLLLITMALSIGPLSVMRSGRRPVNIYLRRDTGVWAAISGLLHLLLATYLVMTPDYVSQYVNIDADGVGEEFRGMLFLWGSLFAYMVGILFLLLLALSNDRVMRTLGPKWWKRLQRSAYITFILTIVHAWAFQLLEARNILLMALLLVMVTLVVGLQLGGYVVLRKLVSDNN